MTVIYTPIVNTTFVKIYEYIACFKEHLVTFTEEILNRKLHFLCGDFYVEKAHNISHIYIRITGLIVNTKEEELWHVFQHNTRDVSLVDFEKCYLLRLINRISIIVFKVHGNPRKHEKYYNQLESDLAKLVSAYIYVDKSL